MKILITTGVYPPEIGGPATYSKLLFDELPKRGFAVEVLPFGEVRHLPKIIRHLVYFFKILKRGRRADVIYAQDPVSVGLPTMLSIWFFSLGNSIPKSKRKKFFIRIAGDYAWEQGVQRFGVKDNLDDFSAQQKGYSWLVQFFKKIQTKVAQSADLIIVPSHYFKTIIVNWGVNPEKIKVIYNGIELNELSPLDLSRRQAGSTPREDGTDDWRSQSSVSASVERSGPFQIISASDSEAKTCPAEVSVTPTILSVGRLVPWKGFKVLIETMPNILQEIPTVRLIIVGDGPQKAELEKIITQLNLQKNVILTGCLSREELFKQKQRVDVFILNTSFESFSFDTVEAMSLGLPVIATRIGSLPELIENNQEGILVEPNNKEEIKKAIMKIFQDDDFRKKIIHNALQKVQKFSIQNSLNELEKMLKL